MFIGIITALIFALGVATVLLSGRVAARFYSYSKQCEKEPKKLSIAICLQLIGEAIIGFGTLAFAAAAHWGYLNGWSIEFQSAIRFAMFFATSVTTWHLCKVLGKIEYQINENEE